MCSFLAQSMEPEKEENNGAKIIENNPVFKTRVVVEKWTHNRTDATVQLESL